MRPKYSYPYVVFPNQPSVPPPSKPPSFFVAEFLFLIVVPVTPNMRSSPIPLPPNRRQEPFTRGRDNPFFQGMRRGHVVSAERSKSGILDFQEKHTSRIVSRSVSDIGDRQPRKIDLDLTNISEITYSSSENSLEDDVPETQERSLPENRLNVSKPTTYPSPTILSDSSIGIEEHEFAKESHSTTSESEASEECHILTVPSKHMVERSFSVKKNQTNISGIPLPPSASSFYNVFSQRIEIVESCESLNKLNQFLKARREDVNAGVPGKFLHAVMGQDLIDAGSVASTIMYAFYLNETSRNSQLCTLPVINMKRADLNSHAEVKWLLDSCDVDQSSLIFADEIDLSYYHLFGSLKLVLLNGDRLPAKQESLKEALIEIFNCKKGDPSYPWVQNITVAQDCSCSTLISEKFAMTSPQMLAGQRFSRLLLAGILMDTGNLSNSKCTSKDKYMATLLINGAGRFGCNGLYQILRYKMYDISNLKVGDILRKDFKKWTRVGKADLSGTRLMVSHIGMSSIGISVEELLAHDDNSVQKISHFQQSEKLRLLMVVSGYYDSQKNFKREIMVSAESAELMKKLLNFFNTHSSQLPLKVWHLPGLREEMKAFEIDKVTSRKTIERLLEEFGGTSRKI